MTRAINYPDLLQLIENTKYASRGSYELAEGSTVGAQFSDEQYTYEIRKLRDVQSRRESYHRSRRYRTNHRRLAQQIQRGTFKSIKDDFGVYEQTTPRKT